MILRETQNKNKKKGDLKDDGSIRWHVTNQVIFKY